MAIYWVAVEELPTKKEADEANALPKLILPPVAVEARDDKDAALKVAMAHPDMIKSANQDRLQVLVRPF
mgnify:CR=1 FL=1